MMMMVPLPIVPIIFYNKFDKEAAKRLKETRLAIQQTLRRWFNS